MDIIEASQEAHDEFVRAVQRLVGRASPDLQVALDQFHEAARAVDAEIQARKDEAAALAAEIERLRAAKTALEA